MGLESIRVHEGRDLISVRMAVTKHARKLRFGTLDQTRVVTAISELARNMLIHGGGGEVLIEDLAGAKRGLRVVCADKGKGIEDVDAAMVDGYSTRKTLGLGLPGTKRLVDEFQLESARPGGTTVTVVKWAR